MSRKTGLGKGMAALLPVEEEGKRFFLCPIEEIRPNRSQPRKHFSEEKLGELAASIREKGVIQPLVVRRKGDHYELIAGERRWRASQKAGLREVPVVVQDASDHVALELALIENIQRHDLNAVEEAEAYRALVENFNLSQEELAVRVGKDRSTIANALRLLKLPPEIKRDIAEESLSMGHARALLSLPDASTQRQVREEVLRKRLSVRETEALVKRAKEGKKAAPRTVNDPHFADLEERMKRHFGCRVTIRRSGSGGKVEIPFHDLQDLDRIFEIFDL